MPPLRYSVAIDPGHVGWLVLQESSDFEGWVIVAKAKTQEEAKAFVKQVEDLERQWWVRRKRPRLSP